MPRVMIQMSTLEQIDDMLKRLYTIENILLNLTDVIDIANDYNGRLTSLEKKMETKPSVVSESDVSTIEMLNRHYKDFVDEIIKLPIPNNFKSNAIFFLDSGLLWLIEGARTVEPNLNSEILSHGNENHSEETKESLNKVPKGIISTQASNAEKTGS